MVVLVRQANRAAGRCGNHDLIACLTRAHTSRLSASVAVARLGLAAAADQADNQERLSLLPACLVVSASWHKMSA